MKIVALVGQSGTGKSYKALHLAHEKEIEYIIDDGLLIKGNKILAGKSAKRRIRSLSSENGTFPRRRASTAGKIRNSESKTLIKY